jgi:hypothetical protein
MTRVMMATLTDDNDDHAGTTTATWNGTFVTVYKSTAQLHILCTITLPL